MDYCNVPLPKSLWFTWIFKTSLMLESLKTITLYYLLLKTAFTCLDYHMLNAQMSEFSIKSIKRFHLWLSTGVRGVLAVPDLLCFVFSTAVLSIPFWRPQSFSNPVEDPPKSNFPLSHFPGFILLSPVVTFALFYEFSTVTRADVSACLGDCKIL